MTRRLIVLLFVTVCGCSNKLTGSLEINGKSFTPTACENLVRIGQRGVELRDESSRKVRLIERPDGGADVYWFPSGSGKGTKYADCATLTLETQSSKINNVKNIKGKAKLDCSKDDDGLSGSVTFENCH